VDPVHEAAHEINYVYVIGSDKISAELDNLLRVADVESEDLTLNYKYDAEDDPEQLYRRSDHYNFARHKIPVVFFFTGLHADYHQPTDTIDKILFGRMARIARVIYDLGWKIANLEHPLIKKTGE
jgi:Zn-dependent M28 family amino/carboxypeptidase